MLPRACLPLLGVLLLAACAGNIQPGSSRVEMYGEVKTGYEYQHRH